MNDTKSNLPDTVPQAASDRNGTLSGPVQGSLKLSDIAYARIVAAISNGDYPVGGKLPTEHELAEQMAVSRPIIREALSRLRDDGLVISRRGSGTYVQRNLMPDDRRLAPLSSISDMRRCLEFRLSYEQQTAYQAAIALTSDGQSRINQALAQLERGLSGGEIDIDDDFNFHLAIAHATENRFFVGGLSGMREPVMSGMTITRNFALLRTHERLLALHEEHVRIADAISARDPEAAHTAMRLHIENAMNRAFEGGN